MIWVSAIKSHKDVYLTMFLACFASRLGQESGDDEYKGDQSDSDDEVDSDFDIDEGDEPGSDQDDDEPKRKRRVVTKAYKVGNSGALRSFPHGQNLAIPDYQLVLFLKPF